MIRIAHDNDLSEIMLIVQQTIEDMEIWGNKQWNSSYPNTTTFQADINNGNLYVFEEAKRCVAFIALDTNDPKAYSGLNWRSQQSHLVFHRFAVHRDNKGNGIAFSLLSFGENLALKLGVHYLRIDTNSQNLPMNNLIKKFGFSEIDRVYFRNISDEFVCYDKLLDS